MQQLLQIALIVILAKVASEAFDRVGQSPIVGQVLVGIILGPSLLNIVIYDEVIEMLSQLGIVFLIFLVGLQSSAKEIREVGTESASSALGGVVLPFVLGFASAYALGFDWEEGAILGASLSATSISISAGVLMDLGKIRTKVAEIIMGAAVIDDVLGLLILTFIVALLGVGGRDPTVSILLAVLFWAVLFPLGWKVIPRLTPYFRKMKTEGAVFVMILGLLFLFASAAEIAGLAAIVGAFLIGLMLSGTDSDRTVRNILPLYYFLGPMFFVSVGLHFDLSSLVSVPLLLVMVTVMALVGKIAGCGLATRALGVKWVPSLFLGVGMIPRGEVALIIAGFARTFEKTAGHPILGKELFSVIAGMSIVTIIITPILLKYLVDNYGEALNEVE